MLATAYLSAIWLAAGFLTGVTSFGGNLFAIPLMSLAIEIREAIVIGLIACFAMSITLGFFYFKSICWKEVVFLGFAALAAVPPGTWILGHAGAKILFLLAGGAIALFVIWQLISSILMHSDKPVPVWTAIPFGLLSGLMMSSIGMGGPLLALYAYMRRWDRQTTLSSLNFAALIQYVFILPAYAGAGFFTADMTWPALFCCLFAAGGILLTLPLVNRINVRMFRRLLLATIFFSAVMLLGRGFLV